MSAIAAAVPQLQSHDYSLAAVAGKTSTIYRKGDTIYFQGDTAEAAYYVERGRVLLSVTSRHGKEAVVGIVGVGGYLGEHCVFEREQYPSSAIALENSTLARIPRHELRKLLKTSPEFSETFLHGLVRRKSQTEEDLADQVFSSSELRLARVLLNLAHEGGSSSAKSVPRLSQATLATIVGTTRPRISYFLCKFREQGLIAYDRGIRVNTDRMQAMLSQ